MIKNDIGQEAKKSLKEIICELFIKDIKEINEKNHKELKEDFGKVSSRVTSINSNIEDLKETSTKEIKKHGKELKWINDSIEDTKGDIEGVIGNSEKITSELIANNKSEIINKVDDLLNIIKDVKQKHDLKLNEVRIEVSEKVDKFKEEQNILIHTEVDKLEELLKENKKLVETEFNELRKKIDNNKEIDREFKNIKTSIDLSKEELLVRINEINKINTKKNYIFYSIIIGLILINMYLVKF